MTHPPASSDFRAYLAYLLRVARMLLLFGLISLPLLAGYASLLQRTGECMTIEQLARRSRGAPMTWLSAYYHSSQLRPQIAARLQPEVTAIGSSRVMQFRSAMFDRLPPDRFYVAGTSGNFTLPALLTLKRLLAADQKPKLVLLGLDYWWFESTVPPAEQTHARLARWLPPGTCRRLRESRQILGEWTSMALDHVQLAQQAWRDERFHAALTAPRVDPNTGRKLYGVHAHCTGDGIRNDGSYRYTRRIRGLEQEGIRDGGLDAVDKGRRAYTGNYLSAAALDDLREFIALCRGADVKLIVFLPPLHPDVAAALRADPATAGFWQNWPGTTAAICRSADVPCHDCSDPTPILAGGGDMLDYMHGSEKLYGRLLLQMCRTPGSAELLAPYVDSDRLAAVVNRAGQRWSLYGD